MQWEMQHAKSKQRQIVMAWLDLENAYGSVRHMLVPFALKWYHVPQKVSELLFRYYDGIFLKVVTEDWSSDYFHLGIGVPHALPRRLCLMLPFRWSWICGWLTRCEPLLPLC